ncbi:Polyamine oxidase 1 [Exaiptasia diaphana]|nr:Polyamine oxidase 1 [Exaiptasia diaphana]
MLCYAMLCYAMLCYAMLCYQQDKFMNDCNSFSQVEIAGYRIEKGANWIHFYDDEESAPLWNAKLKNNLRGIINDYSNLIIRDENGKNITNKATYDKLLKIFGNLEDAQEKRKKDKKSPIPARVGLSLMGWKPKTQAEYALEYLEVDFENAKNAELTPFQGIIEKGKDFFLTDERGMWSIYEELYTSFKDKIKLNTTVTGIKYNSSMVEVITDQTCVKIYRLRSFE